MTIIFGVLDKLIGLRVSEEEEIKGLDMEEHGLLSSYADFMPTVEEMPSVTTTYVAPAAVTAPSVAPSTGEHKLSKVCVITSQNRFEALKAALDKLGITGMTMSHVLGCGIQKGKPEYYRGVEVEPTLLPKIQLDIVVSKVPVRSVIETAKKVLYTGHIGDGKIFVYDVENVVKVRTGEEGYDALQDVE